MANYPAPLIRNEGDTLALQTTRSTTTAGNTYYAFLPNVHQVILYNPVEDWRLHLNPTIKDIIWYDASATADARFKIAGSTTTLLRDLTDSKSGTGSGTAWDSFTTSDFIYICTADIVAGFPPLVNSDFYRTLRTVEDKVRIISNGKEAVVLRE